MAKNLVAFAKTKDFQPVLEELESICEQKPHFNKSEIMRQGVALIVAIFKASPEDQKQLRKALKKANIQLLFYKPSKELT